MPDELVPKPSAEMASTLPEVEFALVLSRTIDAVKENPAQLRQMIYEQARIALRRDIPQGAPEETARLCQALESAIAGVEKFAVVEDAQVLPVNRALPPNGSARALPPSSTARMVGHYSSEAAHTSNPPSYEFEHDDIGQDPVRAIVDVSPIQVRNARSKMLRYIGICAGLFVIAATLVVSAISARRTWLHSASTQVATTKPVDAAQSASAASSQAASSQTAAVAPPPSAPPKPAFPMPLTYGAYAINNGQLVELSLLEGLVPDKRVAIASPFRTPAKNVLTDGSPTFVIFRRDLASIPSDDIEVRVIAHIARTMKFDSSVKGSPNYAKEDELWSIRGITYKFKAAPVAGYAEVMVLHSENPGVTLPPGRYALVLKRQGYDFTVPGTVTDPNHCLERTEAANGTFYSSCEKKR